MKSSKWWIHSNVDIQEDATYKVDFTGCCNISDEGDNDDTANIVSSCIINVDNIETEGTGAVSIVL